MNISISEFDNTLFIPSDGGITVIYDSSHDPLNFAKDILIVTDIYSYDLANRTITAALYKNIQDNSDIDTAKLAQIETDILDILGAINTGFSQNLNYQTEISINDLLKMAHVELEANTGNNYLDKLYGIIDSAQQLLSKRLVILINQRQLLSHSELQALLQYVENNHFSVLFIEKNCEDKLDHENMLIIDDDLYDFSTNS